MREFWVASGHHLSRRRPNGWLAVTDELLIAYLARPELVPPEEACGAERALHAGLMRDPRRVVPEAEVAALADPDARENWELMLRFRQTLLDAGTVEGAYLDLVRAGAAGIPPIFLDQSVHLILRNALDGCDDPFVLRAAELFFRPQRISTGDQGLILADEEIVAEFEAGQAVSPLVAMLGQGPVAGLDVMDDHNAWTYWSRSDAHTMALNLGASPRSREGLARAVEAFVRHLLGVNVRVSPVPAIEDPDWRWFVGLDAEASRIGNILWRGERVDPATLGRVLALFHLVFEPGAAVLPRAEGHPVYLLLAMTKDRGLRMKPQNLIVGLPLAEGAARP